MDADRFDALSRTLTCARSRRTTLAALLGTLLATGLPRLAPDALAASERTKGKGKTRHGQASRKHDRHRGQRAGSNDRPEHENDRGQAPTDELTDEPTLEPVEKTLLPDRGAVSTQAVSSATCLPPGAKPCRKGSDCCSGRCKRKKRKCLPCLTGTDYCAARTTCIPSGTACCAYAECYEFVTAWGSEGSGDGQFDWPEDVAISSDGFVYIADRGNLRIQKFTIDGTFVTKWGHFGSGDGEFKAPRGVAVDAKGNVYIADRDTDRVQKFDADGGFVAQWGEWGSGNGQFKSPARIAIDQDGHVFVTDSGNARVQKFDEDGAYLGQWGERGTGDGQFHSPQGIAVDDAGNVYVTDEGDESDYPADRVQKFTSAGAFIAAWGGHGTAEGKFSHPMGVTTDHAGNVYVVDEANSRIQKFTSSGTLLTIWGHDGQQLDAFFSPFGAAVSGDGMVYIADAGRRSIRVFALA